MASTVIGIFDDVEGAQEAVEKLADAGFSRGSVDVSVQIITYSDDSAASTNEASPGGQQNTGDPRGEANDGGIDRFFNSLFGDNDDRSTYSRIADECSVVTVHAGGDDEAERAADILDEAGAINVNDRAAQYGYGSPGSTTEATTDKAEPRQANDDQTIKVIEENLDVSKKTVETGGVRLRSRIVSRPVEENVRLREERVRVQRKPVDRPATDADLKAFQEGEISMTEHTEVPVVSKTARVVEEISVSKDVSEREETIRDTVRRTDVDVESLDSTDQPARTDQKPSDDDVTYSTK